MTAGVGLVPFIPSGFALYLFTIVLAASNSLFAPAATGLVSVYANADEQGTVLGAAQATAALGRMAGPLALGWGYDRFGATAAFIVAGIVMLAGALFAMQLEPIPHVAAAPLAPMGDSGHAGPA
jgi:predicted MFS family arabinose efflux permease